ncbi:MAG: hypothetical protein H6867_04025 [Rhodospirillales bacterium]|nr:hypothetical protein [Rhodospirillales bacterium]MCB9996318.1 hypothetical protein [Rhodospirillales bacterium]
MMRPARTAESGNAFFMVMVGVVLFAALMYTFSRGARQGGENMTEKQAQIAATDIISYAQSAERAVNRVYSKSRSENAISFENGIVGGYTNANCPASNNRCKVFNSDGGGISWSSADNFASPSPWLFSGENTVAGIGQDGNADLLLILPQLSSVVCREINEALDISAMPTDGNGIEDSTKFQGSYNASAQISGAAVSGVFSACVQDTSPDPDEYFYYQVLLPR